MNPVVLVLETRQAPLFPRPEGMVIETSSRWSFTIDRLAAADLRPAGPSGLDLGRDPPRSTFGVGPFSTV